MVADYDTDLNNRSEKLSELMIDRHVKDYSPKGKSVMDLNLNCGDEDDLKPNHIEKLSLALENGIKEGSAKAKIQKSRSVHSEHEESVSMKEEFDEISDVYNDKASKELEVIQADLKKLRIDYDELAQENLRFKQQISK